MILSIFEDIIAENDNKKLTTAEFLEKLKINFLIKLQTDKKSLYNESFKISLIAFDSETKNLQYSGAGQPIVIVRKGDSIVLKPEKNSIGENIFGIEYADFSMKNITIKPGDTIYLFSVGYTNQLNSSSGKKMGLNNFTDQLKKTAQFPLVIQKEMLTKYFANWKGNYKQVDDVLLLGIKFLI